jgi:phospholipase/carboxylesterase
MGLSGDGRLRLPAEAVTDTATDTPAPTGHGVVALDDGALLYVPTAPVERLVVLLHGAGGTAAAGLGLLLPHADERGLVLYAPQSSGRTWDLVGTAGYGPDVAHLQRSLDRLLPAVRPAVPTPAIGGFSDGASYALSLGLLNGDVFDAVLAFSPGFATATRPTGSPAFFVSHGRSDRVLPIDRCSRRLVPALRRAGHRVHYREFDGGHEVPAPVVAEALDWLAAVRPGP